MTHCKKYVMSSLRPRKVGLSSTLDRGNRTGANAPLAKLPESAQLLYLLV